GGAPPLPVPPVRRRSARLSWQPLRLHGSGARPRRDPPPLRGRAARRGRARARRNAASEERHPGTRAAAPRREPHGQRLCRSIRLAATMRSRAVVPACMVIGAVCAACSAVLGFDDLAFDLGPRADGGAVGGQGGAGTGTSSSTASGGGASSGGGA